MSVLKDMGVVYPRFAYNLAPEDVSSHALNLECFVRDGGPSRVSFAIR